jgi:hypothetical protein
MEAHHDDGHKPFERKHDGFEQVHTRPLSVRRGCRLPRYLEQPDVEKPSRAGKLQGRLRRSAGAYIESLTQVPDRSPSKLES